MGKAVVNVGQAMLHDVSTMLDHQENGQPSEISNETRPYRNAPLKRRVPLSLKLWAPFATGHKRHHANFYGVEDFSNIVAYYGGDEAEATLAGKIVCKNHNVSYDAIFTGEQVRTYFKDHQDRIDNARGLKGTDMD